MKLRELMDVIGRKKLIEVALPLDALNAESGREKGNPFLKGHPRSLHQWWARQPLSVARAVLFAQLVDDPSSRPDLFPTEEAQFQERQRLVDIIEQLIKWENTTDEAVLETAREEIRKSWRRTCEENKDHPEAAELFDPERLPVFHDPFAGGGSIPLEAQRLGLEAHASDLNPVAVLINKAMIELPPKFSGHPPVNPDSRKGSGSVGAQWRGATGLAEDVRYYGQWIRDEAERRIGHLYPKIEITRDMAQDRPDLKQYVDRTLPVIAWLWARTVKSPNPAFAEVDVPLVSTFVLSTKKGRQAYVEPVIEGSEYRFTVKVGIPPDAARRGTKLARGANFQCLLSGTPIDGGYIKTEGQADRMGVRLMAIVAQGDRGRVNLTPTLAHELVAGGACPEGVPIQKMPNDPRNVWCVLYGLTIFAHLFTDRQLVALTTLSDLIGEVCGHVRRDAEVASMSDDGVSLARGGAGAIAYAEAISCYLALALSKQADYGNAMCTWNHENQNVGHLFTKQAIPMAWDFPEASPIQGGLSYGAIAQGIAECLGKLPNTGVGSSYQQDYLENSPNGSCRILSIDPPYYDNVGYADLSDFFYVWLRRSVRVTFPDLLATLTAPKAGELIANPCRHASKEEAEEFFLAGMKRAVSRLCREAHPAFPITIYYAFKQSEKKADIGTTSTGWETFLDAVVHSGLNISGTWPIRTQNRSRMVGQGTNALASSIILVCRRRSPNAPMATRMEFISNLKAELPEALRQMQAGNIAPVDLAQAAIGPGMAVFSRYAKVLNASGESVSVREALALINQTLDEVLAEQEGDFDADTRWALSWFEQTGFAEGDFGMAETLSKAKNTSVSGMIEAGILTSGAGKVRLLRPDELAEDWDPEKDRRFTMWEATHHLIHVLDCGETVAAEMMAKLGPDAETTRELAYRLYRICDQKNRSQEAQSYNALVQSWPEIARLAQEAVRTPRQATFVGDETST